MSVKATLHDFRSTAGTSPAPVVKFGLIPSMATITYFISEQPAASVFMYYCK